MSLFAVPQTEDDLRARRRIRESLDESLIVEAAAGTGKTTELVRRIVGVLQKGLGEVQDIVAVTFTRKAAGELKLRLRQGLDQARREADHPEEGCRLDEALAHLEEARIGTIHSFCTEILRERPVEARVDPAFEELSETEAPRLYEQAFRRWIQQRLNDLPQGLRRALTRVSMWGPSDGHSPLDRLRDAGWQLIEWRDFPAQWRREPFDREAEISAMVEPVLQLADWSAACTYSADYLRRSLAPARDFAAWYRRTREIRDINIDDLEALLAKLLRELRRDQRKGRGLYSEEVSREQVLQARQDLIDQLDQLLQRADADLAACLQADLRELVGEYEDLKRRSGKLDFVDLLIFVRNLLIGNQSVRNYFQKRFSHIFVDEFQDTDPLQAEILLLLTADDPEESDWRQVRPLPGKLFLVGDPKQSIYRFRRADVLLYQEVSRNLQQRGVGLVHLGRSFRSVAPIQQMVNSAFAPEMSGDSVSGQPSYVPLEHFRTASSQQPCLIALPVPCPYGWTRIARTSIEAWLPDTAGAFVDWLINESGWKVGDPDQAGDPVPIAPRHVCLLFRRFVSWGNDMTRDYTSALEARGIPHQLVGARSFHQREEVETLKAALMAIEWPDDELSVFAALKGTLFAIPDNLLLRFKLTQGKLHPFRPLPLDLDADFEPIAEALGLLKKLHRKRNRRPVVHTVNALLEATRAHAGFALRPAGNQVLANVQRVCDMARAFEVGGGLSFRGFVEQFKRAAEQGGDSEGPHLEEGAEGVRIMTVHAAKGLEFPVVLLADMTAHLARYQPDKTVDMGKGLCAIRLLGCSPWELLDHQELERRRDEAEGVRLAYVAATRARDILIVPTVGDEKLEGWLSPLSKAVYPSKENWRESSPAPGCPEFGQASVMQRPQAHDGKPEFSVKPGLHRPEQGRHQVVWWDPRLLKLGVEGNFGLRQEQILAEDKGGKASQEGMRRYQEWKRRRREAIEAGCRPEFEVFTASEVEEPPSWKFDIRLEVAEREEPRPSGKRFGTLVHTLLRDVDWEADESSIGQLARLHGRVLGSDEREVRSAVRAVATALAHPLMNQARSSARCHRELPVLLDVKGGRILEGTIDLLFEQQDGWTVVDFKTDADLKVRQQHYEAQLAWYLEAVTKLTGKQVRGVLLGI